MTQWQGFATSKTGAHLTLSYGNDASWGLSYNLFGDKLLGLKLFPQSVYAMREFFRALRPDVEYDVFVCRDRMVQLAREYVSIPHRQFMWLTLAYR